MVTNYPQLIYLKKYLALHFLKITFVCSLFLDNKNYMLKKYSVKPNSSFLGALTNFMRSSKCLTKTDLNVVLDALDMSLYRFCSN